MNTISRLEAYLEYYDSQIENLISECEEYPEEIRKIEKARVREREELRASLKRATHRKVSFSPIEMFARVNKKTKAVYVYFRRYETKSSSGKRSKVISKNGRSGYKAQRIKQFCETWEYPITQKYYDRARAIEKFTSGHAAKIKALNDQIKLIRKEILLREETDDTVEFGI